MSKIKRIICLLLLFIPLILLSNSATAEYIIPRAFNFSGEIFSVGTGDFIDKFSDGYLSVGDKFAGGASWVISFEHADWLRVDLISYWIDVDFGNGDIGHLEALPDRYATNVWDGDTSTWINTFHNFGIDYMDYGLNVPIDTLDVLYSPTDEDHLGLGMSITYNFTNESFYNNFFVSVH